MSMQNHSQQRNDPTPETHAQLNSVGLGTCIIRTYTDTVLFVNSAKTFLIKYQNHWLKLVDNQSLPRSRKCKILRAQENFTAQALPRHMSHPTLVL